MSIVKEIPATDENLTVDAARARKLSESAPDNGLQTPPRSPTLPSTNGSKLRFARLFPADRTFDPHTHYYPRALNAQLHPMVAAFMNLGNERIIERFCHLNPTVSKSALIKLLATECQHFRWSGADLFNVTNSRGKRSMIVIETNSCPSGQKSMPNSLNTDTTSDDNVSGYHTIIKSTFKQLLDDSSTSMVKDGALAVIYDKNDMEASGYAAAMVDIFHEPVYLTEFYVNDSDPPVRWTDDVMSVRVAADQWVPVRAAFRYVTQKPWNRIPLKSKTLILNPVIACLAGGRNKMIADKSYEFYNHELASQSTGLSIRVPETIRDVSKSEIPLWVRSMGGLAVIKIPYSNAGQGVFTITNQGELDAFMAAEHHYDKFIVQSLVGNASWISSVNQSQRPNLFFHCGTIPNKKLETFVCDIRCMISSTHKGFQPLAVYARRAMAPLKPELSSADDSWKMLGTNLSEKREDGSWTTDTSRLLLMDCKDFNRLGVAIDELIDAYVQTCLATLAIDRMASRLTKNNSDEFDRELYESLNNDRALLDEILRVD